jgi:hypothetical protein
MVVILYGPPLGNPKKLEVQSVEALGSGEPNLDDGVLVSASLTFGTNPSVSIDLTPAKTRLSLTIGVEDAGIA